MLACALFFTFDREPGVRRLIGREVLTRVVEGEERVADAADKLELVENHALKQRR